MRMHARRLAAVAALTVPAVAAGQGHQFVERHTVEAYAARYALDEKLGTVTTNAFTGFGARLLFERVNPDRPATNFFARTIGGLFATYTAAQGTPSVTTLHAGVETDIPVLPQPLAGAVDPFVSVGIGLFRTSRENQSPESNHKRFSRTDFAFTPAVGTRLGLVDRVGARADLRMPIIFGASTTANFVAEGGLYFTF